MEIKTLRTFETFISVSKTLCLSRSAELLDCNPSTITRRLKSLELETGCSLIACHSKVVELTPQGEAFLPKIEDLVNRYREAIDSIGPCANLLQGEVVIGMHQPAAYLLSELVLMEIQEKFPNLKLKILTIPPRYMSSMEGCDITFTPIQPTDKDLIARPLGSAREYFCAATDYLARYGEPATLSELANHKLISTLFTGSETKCWKWNHANGEHGLIDIKPNMTVDSHQISTQWMLAGFGISMVPERWLSRITQGGYRILFDSQYYVERELFAVYRSRHYLNDGLRMLIDHIARVLQSSRLKHRPLSPTGQL
ncbi:LysR family transcriptional regulator [Shewanella youngdeokensis]|uniref:LysR family transcriptional regulator n=1 Tax=Shewanella youngdeokensis TaxID=2999068 RepID=A0ABZ0JYZ1_9GAMM|nr:LysR family transcriptional regulator [Shewanella sp. DAU334]